MNLALTTIEQGLIYSVLAMGVYFTYKILDIADLSVEGSFPFGALLFAKLVSSGVDPIIGTILTFIIGTLTGLLTSALFISLRIKALLAGILTMTMLYSINLRLNGKPNISLTDQKLIFDYLNTGNKYIDKLIILIIIVAISKFLIDKFLKTEAGYLLVATGDNESLVRSLGESSNKYKIMGLMISNGLVALSGALLAQTNKFADITMGVSIIVAALASIIIGDTIFRHRKLRGTTRAIIGAIIYRIIGTIALKIGLSPQDLRLINGLIVVVFIAYNNFYSAKFAGRFRRNTNA
ncbi:MAG: ABC transporter permease [Tissierellia bacterium]|nr:ABC transporter permease [Tissierellia bacterium]